MTSRVLDYAASPTLTTLRDLIGDAAVIKLLGARGGTHVHLPKTVTPDCELARIVGVEAAESIVRHFGSDQSLRLPTGKGFAHGRVIDHAEVVRRFGAGEPARSIALAMGCTERQIWNILASRIRDRDERQLNLL